MSATNPRVISASTSATPPYFLTLFGVGMLGEPTEPCECAPAGLDYSRYVVSRLGSSDFVLAFCHCLVQCPTGLVW